MKGWIEVPSIGWLRTSAIIRVGELEGCPAHLIYVIYMTGKRDFEVLERDTPRDILLNQIWAEEDT